ncbi:MAG: hypothetical protein BWY42_01299 [Candidatus Omnitrophica bacterium ADurb.Bin277]|nr:MAG: hypothetical protein BWY42_01299 [Candidatus Omnitrophica bacterium ADurb.Bin277]
MLESQEVVAHCGGNEREQDHQKLHLLFQVSFAGLEDRLRHIEHRLVGGKRFDLDELIEGHSDGPEYYDGAVEKDLESGKSAEHVEAALMEVRDLQIRFAGPRNGLPKEDRSQRSKSCQ